MSQFRTHRILRMKFTVVNPSHIYILTKFGMCSFHKYMVLCNALLQRQWTLCCVYSIYYKYIINPKISPFTEVRLFKVTGTLGSAFTPEKRSIEIFFTTGRERHLQTISNYHYLKYQLKAQSFQMLLCAGYKNDNNRKMPQTSVVSNRDVHYYFVSF